MHSSSLKNYKNFLESKKGRKKENAMKSSFSSVFFLKTFDKKSYKIVISKFSMLFEENENSFYKKFSGENESFIDKCGKRVYFLN